MSPRYVAWRRALLREMDSETSAVEDPVLAVGWGQELLCYSVSRSASSSHFEFRQQRRHIAAGDILNVQWVSDGLLGFITALDDFRLYDPFSDCYVATIDIKHIKLVFYVPPAAPVASSGSPAVLHTPSYHNSVTFSDQRLFMMAADGGHRAEVLSWRGRIAALVQPPAPNNITEFEYQTSRCAGAARRLDVRAASGDGLLRGACTGCCRAAA